MDTYVPTTMLLWLEGFRQHFPAQHFAYFRGYVWALAMLGTTRGSSALNRGHEHQRATMRCSAREGRPRCLGGVHRGGGT
jgi:hypothetical protein